MAEQVALSTYLEEIDTRIRKNRAADAFALCKYILRYYPKHLETYSLMGQALLQLREMNGALDIFRRVLSADPENAGAYAGMARIFDARSQLDEAIWHIERAYELTPTHAEIRQELLRLYARVEGKPRERLKLTRGALARLYVQEGLYAQAIREFREISAATPAQYDIRVALAETLWRAGQTRQAADVAQSLLDPLPYCLKANLILGTAWQESAIEESDSFLQRAQVLDPSNQVAYRLFGQRSPLPLVPIKISRYEGDVPLTPPSEEDRGVQARREQINVMETNFEIPPLVAPEPKVVPAEAAPAQEAEPPVSTHEPTPAREESFEPPSSAIGSLTTPLTEETTPAETPPAEVKSDSEEAPPDWLIELQKNFAVDLETALPTFGFEEKLSEPEPSPGLPQTEPAPIISAEEMQESESVHVEPTVGEELPVESELAFTAVEEPSPIESIHEAKETEPIELPISETQPLLGTVPDSMVAAEEETALMDSAQEQHTVNPEEVALPEMESALTEEPPPIAESATPVEPPQVKVESESAQRAESEPSWLHGASAEAHIEDESAKKEEMPDWLGGSAAMASTEPEKPPEVKIPKWVEVLSQPPREPERGVEREAPTELAPQAEPTATEEPGLQPISEATPPKPMVTEPEAPILTETRPTEPIAPAALPQPPAAQEAEPASPKPNRQPKYYARLVQARQNRDENRWSDAFVEYEFVINKAPRLVGEVIMDLEALVASGDAPLDAHRLLGDAYARAGRLNDALERYRFVYNRVAESE